MKDGWDMEGFSTELLLKIPKEKEKPPVIAVVFTRVKEACEWNQDLINEHSTLPFFIKFNQYTSSKGLSFELGSEKLSGKRFYKDLKYDKVKLENFLYLTRSRNKFIFTHLLYDFEQYFVVSTLDKYKRFELTIERLYLAQ
ncbi:hypothetical protein [Aurantibacillus circumpalustris]|uniref:hypothetical protein n=1 Tax=Aurantibacillus circumpalustris TaxID=3036359 RepID=UPI00295B9B15|nr:hypothetical protein [Aurantibacillus circumpalustris]